MESKPIFLRSLQPLQLAGLFLGTSHLVVLFVYAFIISPSSQGLSSTTVSNSFSISELDETAQVVMSKFNRTEFKEGNRHWNIEANSARYLSNKNIVLLEDPFVKVFKENNEPPTIIKALSARLSLVDGDIKNALLQGDVSITLSDDSRVLTESAEYRNKDGRIVSPDKVTIEGPSYKITGNRMEILIEKGFVSIYEDIDSYFDFHNKESKSKTKRLKISNLK